MIPVRRDYSLAKDQPILRRARSRGRSVSRPRSEVDFWKMFDIDRLARSWRPVLKVSAAQG